MKKVFYLVSLSLIFSYGKAVVRPDEPTLFISSSLKTALKIHSNKIKNSRAIVKKYEPFIHILDSCIFTQDYYEYLLKLDLFELGQEYKNLIQKVEEILLEVCTIQEEVLPCSSFMRDQYFSAMDALLSIIKEISKEIPAYDSSQVIFYEQMYLKARNEHSHHEIYNPRCFIYNDAIDEIKTEKIRKKLLKLKINSKYNQFFLQKIKDFSLTCGYMLRMYTLSNRNKQAILFCANWWKNKAYDIDFNKKEIKSNSNFLQWSELCYRCWKYLKN